MDRFMQKYKYRLLSLFCFVFLFLFAMGFASMPDKKASAAAALPDADTGTFSMDVGSALKLSDTNGIRFKVTLSREYAAVIKENENVTLHFSIMPEKMYQAISAGTDGFERGNYAAPAESGQCTRVDVEDESNVYLKDGMFHAHGCVTSLKERNRKTNYTAIAYIKQDGKVVRYATHDLLSVRGKAYDLANSTLLMEGYTEDVMRYYPWLGEENYPVVLIDEGKKSAFERYGETYEEIKNLHVQCADYVGTLSTAEYPNATTVKIVAYYTHEGQLLKREILNGSTAVNQPTLAAETVDIGGVKYTTAGTWVTELGGRTLADLENVSQSISVYAGLERIWEEANLYGIDEPMAGVVGGRYEFTYNAEGEKDGFVDSAVRNFSLDKTAYLIGALGVKSVRFRIPYDFINHTTGEIRPALQEYLQRAIDELKANGVEQIIGLLEVFPRHVGYEMEAGKKSVPTRENVYYDAWMNAVTDACYKICSAFPAITTWEMGNEMNSPVYFHPNTYVANKNDSMAAGTGGFSAEEHVLVYTDYMYYAAKGIHMASKYNYAFTSGFAFTTNTGDYDSIAQFVDNVYTTIEQGRTPTNAPQKVTDVRSYFDGLAWHPYTSQSGAVTAAWQTGNDSVYQVAIDHGDEGIPVLFTEFGFRDANALGSEEDPGPDAEKEQAQAEYMAQAFAYMQNMPYVKACCAFRLYQSEATVATAGWGQKYWGYFTEDIDGESGISPRYKAVALQELYGGTGDLYRYERNEIFFDSNGGTAVESQWGLVGDKLLAPIAPTWAGADVDEYVFDGWYYGNKKWNFDTDTIPEKNITLVARWKNAYGPNLPSGGI